MMAESYLLELDVPPDFFWKISRGQNSLTASFAICDKD